jgi:serine/threonine protein phosphatase PrpC
MSSSTATAQDKLASGRDCEDVAESRRRTAGDQVIAVLADGAGSASRAKEAAGLAVTTGVRVLEAIDWRDAPSEGEVRSVLLLLLAELGDAIRADCEVDAIATPSDYACTLLAVVASPRWLVTLQVGDGFVVASKSGGDYAVLIPPDKGEFANQTTFATNARPNDAHVAVLHDFGGFFFVSSDGLEHLVLRLEDWSPHEPFFRALEAFTRASDSDACLQTELDRFLTSPTVCERSDDDRSVVVGAYVGTNM